MSVQASRAAQVRTDVRIEIFTVIWMIVEAAVSLLVLFPPRVLPPLPKKPSESRPSRLSPRWFFAILVGKDPVQEYLAGAKVWCSILQ